MENSYGEVVNFPDGRKLSDREIRGISSSTYSKILQNGKDSRDDSNDVLDSFLENLSKGFIVRCGD